ncbi:MAG: hypothetical protein H8E60_07615 [Candidatus Marinimicrobia bacterium]|nr:hypothetical protein [Candidatus Neomarinimicrobiota bacterium]
MANDKGLFRNELAQKTKAPFYLINYLYSLGKLPLIKKGKQGRAHIYAPECINIINKYRSEANNHAV